GFLLWHDHSFAQYDRRHNLWISNCTTTQVRGILSNVALINSDLPIEVEMRTLLLVPACLICGFIVQAQQQPTPTAQKWGAIPSEPESATRAFPQQLRSELAKLRDAAMSDDYAYRQLEHLTDNIGPRPSGSPQADAAAHYVADELRKLGLQVSLEPV